MENLPAENVQTENKSYPRIKNAILLCLLLLGFQTGAGIFFGTIIGIFRIGTDSLIYGVGLIVLSILSFGAVIFIGFKKTNKKFNDVFLFNNISPGLWISVIVFMFGFVIISSELDNFVNFLLPMPEFLQEIFDSLLINDFFIVSIILVGIMPAFLEEMLFRGLFLSGFKDNYSKTKAIFISALLFGLIHLNPYQFVTAFIIGIVTAWLYLELKSIWPCIYMHLFNNLLAVFVMNFKDVFNIEGFNSYTERAFQPLWFNAVGLGLTVTGVLLFFFFLEKAKAKSAL